MTAAPAVLADQPETMTGTLQDSPGGASQRPGSPVHEQPPSLGRPSPSPPRYDSPQEIYERYVAARSAWYAVQPAGSIKTNQQYRRAMGLPLRYVKQSYEWCLDYKQMSKRCITSTGSREWTKEEMMAYLDWTHWSKAEDERIEAQLVGAQKIVSLLEVMGVRRSLGSKAIEHSPAVIAVYNLDSPSRPYFNNHSQRVAVGSVECVSTFSQFLIQREMLSQGAVPLAC
ncbi:hypothetical protein HZ326_25678 [Fusarium oxysporum f. sp. albedinis]|nr:hypothetical protein HZ326_25678 [Fusarium oxysporum f. sp. albedinis]